MVVTSSTYLENLSTLFMEIGRFVPHFQSMAALYPRSTPLQDHLCEYFIEVVKLCHDILRYSKRSNLQHLANLLVTSRLNRYKSTLERWSIMVRDDINSLVAGGIEDDRSENNSFRAGVRSLSSRYATSHRYRQKLRILDMCSTYNH